MATDTRKELADVKARWNYADVIALVVANLEGTEFNGDRSAWLRGVQALAEQYPHLLRGVKFRRRDPFTPYSPQVDEVLKMLGRWEYRGDFNPRFRRIEIPDEGKQDLKRELQPKLSDHADEIAAMSRILHDHIALSGSVAPDDEARSSKS